MPAASLLCQHNACACSLGCASSQVVSMSLGTTRNGSKAIEDWIKEARLFFDRVYATGEVGMWLECPR